jgi:thiol-disulfide isomerase/thioredoxin
MDVSMSHPVVTHRRWIAITLLLLAAGAVWIWYTQPPLDFTLPTLQGEEFTLSAMRGKPVVLNFWATWCEPCKRELPSLQRAAEHYGDQVIIVGVDQGESVAQVTGFVEQFGLTYTIPLDSEFAASGRYNIRGMPTTFFIDAGGTIRSVYVGEMTSMTLAENIAGLLR